MPMLSSLKRLVSKWQELPRRAGSPLPPRSSFDAERALLDHFRLSVIKRFDRYVR